jgi:hypothetical protein
VAFTHVVTPSKRGHLLGVQAPWLTAQPDDLKRCLDKIKGLGVNLVRCPGLADWTFLEPSPGQYRLDRFAFMVNEVTARGMSPVATGSYTPGWILPKAPISPATSSSFGGNGVDYRSPPDPGRLTEAAARYEAALYAFAKAYPQVKIIEAWTNEGNCKWGSIPPRADVTAMMGNAAVNGWKKAHGTTKSVVLTNSTGVHNKADDAFGGRIAYEWHDKVHNALKEKGKTWRYDGVAHHPYMTWGNSFDPNLQQWNNALTHQTEGMIWQAAINGRKKPYVWGTEAGWPTVYGGGVDNDVRYLASVGGGNAEVGAAKVAESHLRYWFKLQDQGFAGSFIMYNYDERDWKGFGLFRSDGSEKPVCGVIRRLAKEPFTWSAGVSI